MSGIDMINPSGGHSPLEMLSAGRRGQSIAKGDDVKQVEKLAKDFEGVLLNKLMDEMQKTIPDSGLLSSPATKQMKGMFWMFLSQSLADKGGIGLARQLTRDFKKMAHITEPTTKPTTDFMK
jgi:Rod binding domain-containing protein